MRNICTLQWNFLQIRYKKMAIFSKHDMKHQKTPLVIFLPSLAVPCRTPNYCISLLEEIGI